MSSSSPRRKGRHSALATTEEDDDGRDTAAASTAATVVGGGARGEARRPGGNGGLLGVTAADTRNGGASESSPASSSLDPLSTEPSNGSAAATMATTPSATTSTSTMTSTTTAASGVSSILPLSQEQLQEQLDQTIKPAIHNFFYPQHHRTQEEDLAEVHPDPTTDEQYYYGGENGAARRNSPSWNEEAFQRRVQEDRRFVHHFWRTYDDIVILSLFTQIGIVFRLATSTYLTFFDGVFSNDSALFVNLPLNSLSCFLMGMLSSGERLMEIVATRFTPPRLQHSLRRDRDDNDDHSDVDDDSDNGANGNGTDDDDDGMEDGVHHLPDASAAAEGHGMAALRHRVVGALRQRRRSRRGRSKSRRRRATYFHSWQPPVQLNSELREVQLLALERRIRASKCLLLFPVRKEDVDVMEHYFQGGYQRKPKRGADAATRNQGSRSHRNRNRHRQRRIRGDNDDDDRGWSDDSSHSEERALDLSFDLELQEELDDDGPSTPPRQQRNGPSRSVEFAAGNSHPSPTRRTHRSKLQRDDNSRPDPLLVGRNESDVDGPMRTVSLPERHVPQSVASPPSNPNPTHQSPMVATPNNLQQENPQEQPTDDTPTTVPIDDTNFEEFFQDVQANVTENFSRLRRVNLADGWDVGTTPDDMADDLLLGLRDGFCGALSSFSSWNSAMVNLMRTDKIGEAFVGYMLGIQLPIIAYRFGQHVAVFLFVWRCRFETRRDERRGYGIRLSMNEVSERDSDDENNENGENGENHQRDGSEGNKASERKIPSVRAIATALFIMALVTQCTSLSFFSDPEKQLIALSLLFSPLGVLARWRLSKLNSWRPTFPLGTFASNIIACALSGSLGRLLEGNPGTRERIVLVSIISGFGGTLSSLAAFVVEILAGLDPILFRFDGVIYAVLSIFWAWVVGFLLSSKADWADQTE